MSIVSASGVILELFNSLKVPFAHEGNSTEHHVDLANSELWRVDLSWSTQARAFRQMATASPEKLTLNVFMKILRSLRVVDKKVTEVDAGMLQYQSLEDLTLTGNLLKTVRGEHLPPQLKVLELCYNQLFWLEDLDSRPPPLLQHLGVGYNCLMSLHLTPSHWKSLLSLDLSNNHLSNLPSSLRTLTQLTALRSLLLVGNPLTLVPCYHGYTVDTLPNLSLLDDSEVTIRDRREASGMAKYCNHHIEIVRTAQVEVTVSTITGLPELLDKGSETEEQMVRYLLQLTHTFLPKKGFKKTVVGGESASVVDGGGATIAGKEEESHTECQGECFKPRIYPSSLTTDLPSITACYQVDDLTGLARFLQQGIELCVLLQKVVYSRSTCEGVGEDDGAGSRPPVSAKGTKSGRATAQSGRSSPNKTQKPDKKPVKGKTKTQPSIELPGEGWHPSTTNTFLLGSCHVDTLPLLANQNTLVHDLTMPLLTSGIRQEGLLQDETIQEVQDGDSAEVSSPELQISMTLAFALKCWNSVADTCMDAVP